MKRANLTFKSTPALASGYLSRSLCGIRRESDETEARQEEVGEFHGLIRGPRPVRDVGVSRIVRGLVKEVFARKDARDAEDGLQI